MKKCLALTVLGIGLVSSIAFADWTTNFDDALTTAKKENKLVLVDFTGSDWCGWCIKLDKDVFSKPEFKKFADSKLVLMEADFPNSKPQSATVKTQNEALQKKYNVDGFPTLVLLDGSGKELARHVGYMQGGPKAFIDWIERSAKGQ